MMPNAFIVITCATTIILRMPMNKLLKNIFENSNIRNTRGRTSILEILAKAEKPITQEQIALKLKKTLNKTTIYRNLESFVKAGLVHRVFLNQRMCAYELSHNCSENQCHPHLTCRKCRKTICITNSSIPMFDNIPGFKIEKQKILFEGLCTSCK